MENIFFPSRDSCGCAQLKFKIRQPPDFLKYLPAPPTPPKQLLIDFPELKQIFDSSPQPKCILNDNLAIREKLKTHRLTSNSFMKSISSLISFTTPSINQTSDSTLQISSLLFIILTIIVILIVFLLIFIGVLYIYLTLTKSKLKKQKNLVYLNSNSSNPSILKSSNEWHQFYPTDSSLTDSTTTSLTKSNLNYSVELRQSSNDFKDQLFANNFLKSNETLNIKPLLVNSAFDQLNINSNLDSQGSITEPIRFYHQNGLFFPRRTLENGFNMNNEQLSHYYESIPDFSQFYFDINSQTIQRNSPHFLKIEQLNGFNRPKY